MSLLDEVLGLGYAGYAKVGEYFVLLDPSSTEEADNLQRANGPLSTELSSGIGSFYTRSRRSLKANLTCPMTKNSLLAALKYTVDWRLQEQEPGPIDLEVFYAHQEGYRSSQAYVDSVSLGAGSGELGKVSFQIQTWTWEWEGGQDPTPATNQAFDPRGDEHLLIPHWAACVQHTGMGGFSMTGWSLEANNNWQYKALLEGSKQRPPNPRVIFPGPLELSMNTEFLARRNDRPEEIGEINLNIDHPRTSQTLMTLTLPRMVRESCNPMGVGSRDEPIKWSARWQAEFEPPTLSVN